MGAYSKSQKILFYLMFSRAVNLLLHCGYYYYFQYCVIQLFGFVSFCRNLPSRDREDEHPSWMMLPGFTSSACVRGRCRVRDSIRELRVPAAAAAGRPIIPARPPEIRATNSIRNLEPNRRSKNDLLAIHFFILKDNGRRSSTSKSASLDHSYC